MSDLIKAMRELVIANRILAKEGVLDAYGHVTIRHPDDPKKFLMSRSRSPELVTLSDIITFNLDCTPIDDLGRPMYAERPIHGAIYEARPDVMAVCHNHAYDLIPFGVTNKPMRPIFHVAGGTGAHVPVWDIKTKFGDKTNLLVVNMEQGRDLAKTFDKNSVALMRGHGAAVGGQSIYECVMVSLYTMVNARVLMDAMRLGGEITYLSPGEIEEQQKVIRSPLAVNRAWEYLVRRAGCENL